MWPMIAISVFAYFIAGLATAVLIILVDGEPRPTNYDEVMIAVAFWPIWLAMYAPILMARWIKARQAASREKPPAYAEEEYP
jgi:hypothetical protein